MKMNFEHLFDVVGFSSETQNNTVLFFVAYLKSNSLYKLIRSFFRSHFGSSACAKENIAEKA